jgi:hypothetical protein
VGIAEKINLRPDSFIERALQYAIISCKMQVKLLIYTKYR